MGELKDGEGKEDLVKTWVLPEMKKLDVNGIVTVSFWGEGKGKEDVLGK